MNTLSVLAKTRPALGKIVCEAVISWTPAALAGCSYNQIRNVEKTLRLIYFHILRHSAAGAYTQQIAEAIETQKARMEAAHIAYTQAKEAEAKRKRDHLADEIVAASAPKRQKLEDGAEPADPSLMAQAGQRDVSPQEAHQNAHAFLNQRVHSATAAVASFDVTSLPLHTVVDLVIANLQSITDETLERAVKRTRANLAGESLPEDQVQDEPRQARPDGTDAAGPSRQGINPLKMDVEEVELDNIPVLTAADGEAEEEGSIAPSKMLENFMLPSPEPIDGPQALELVKSAVGRMCKGAMQDFAVLNAEPFDPFDVSRPTAEPALWAALVVRLATRGFAASPLNGEVNQKLAKYASDIRKIAQSFVEEDPARRIGFANYWLLEEWNCDRQRKKDGQEELYESCLLILLEHFLKELDAKDRWLAAFVADLPALPLAAVERIESLCLNKATMPLGFAILRDIAISRPPSRQAVSESLLKMTKAKDGLLRRGAITTARAWVGVNSPLEAAVLGYARASLQCLVQGRKGEDDEELKKEPKEGVLENGAVEDGKGENGTVEDEEVEMEEGEEDAKDPATTWVPLDVLRYLELSFALCVKVPDLLDEIFAAYPQMSSDNRSSLEKHIAPLVSSMGPSNPKLQSLLRNFPAGADSLALSVFRVLSEKGRSPALVALVKGLVAERNVDPRFLVPIMPDLNKVSVDGRYKARMIH